ncbi:hypothetical protein QNA08_11785 [Chelatococcus sp. SYSU_G07232]|uniref:DUF1311 domain-containing protein n=1 Tax=Chelatococcus albus TaxID=3047466 RepID=A0ABT7AHP6_9HYPH|nr:hypothetical protein [Chelatococcus sp. SYSU_G07232]MDJ1158916.1 hypothetical protein [Chelatococcus sp. SYSU_G07232]
MRSVDVTAGRRGDRAGRRRRLAWAVGVALWLPAAAEAQLTLPGAQAPTPAGETQALPARKGASAPRRPPAEAALIGRELLRHGTQGRLLVERRDKATLTLRLTLEGRAISNPLEPCAVALGVDEPVPLKSLGRPAGLPRYVLEAPVCPVVFDVLSGAVLVSAQTETCTFELADCRADVGGLWGPDGPALAARAAEVERERSRAEAALHESFRRLQARLSGQEVKTVAGEQAAFSSEREMLCRDYAQEAAHGFCAARYTEARAAALKARLAATPEPGRAVPRKVVPKTPAPKAAQPETAEPEATEPGKTQ